MANNVKDDWSWLKHGVHTKVENFLFILPSEGGKKMEQQ